MPAEAVGVYPGPEQAEAEGDGGEQEGEGSAAHLGSGGVFVGEGAEADAGVVHAGGCVREGEEEELIEGGEDEERHRAGDGDGDRLGDEVDGAGEEGGAGEIQVRREVDGRTSSC